MDQGVVCRWSDYHTSLVGGVKSIVPGSRTHDDIAKARQTSFVSHQHPLPLRAAVLTVIIAIQA